LWRRADRNRADRAIERPGQGVGGRDPGAGPQLPTGPGGTRY
jgi:hypothetical protein